MAAVTRWNPWNELFSLHDQMDQLFNEALGSFTGARRNGGEQAPMALPIDIRQTEGAYVLEASVPGFKPEDVEVTVDQNVLTISGTQRAESEEQKGGWIRRERRTGSFHRQVVLPAEVRADEISAGFENGVLTVTVPRAQKAQPKRIPVAAGSPAATTVIDAPQQQS